MTLLMIMNLTAHLFNLFPDLPLKGERKEQKKLAN